MAATERRARSGRWWRRLAGLIGSVLASGAARGVDLPEERADAMFHLYDGGGVRAWGPAMLVRKNFADRASVSGMVYVDMVSSASIDVVTSASPYKETRTEYGAGFDYAVRDALVSLAATSSKEPDYRADSLSADIAQDVFGGMTTINLGFTRGADKVGRHGTPGNVGTATHWRYRLGATQILTPRLLASANLEAVSDDGYLGSPYRAARVFGAAVPERVPATRSSRALQLRLVGDLGSRDALRGSYRYFWDNWDIRAHTMELGYARHFGERWLADAALRYHRQDHALFYSDNAAGETLYVSRNRQLSRFHDVGLGAKLTYLWKQVPGKYEVKLNGAFEFVRYRYQDYTDIRTGSPYAFNASVAQVFVTLAY